MTYNDDWCIAEEVKYLSGNMEIYLPTGIQLLHTKLMEDLEHLMQNPYMSRDYCSGIADALAAIDKRFGEL